MHSPSLNSGLKQLERRDPGAAADEEEEDDVESDADATGTDGDKSDSYSDDVSMDSEAETEPGLRQRIEDALRASGVDAATGDSDDSEEELMDDDQMMAIDDKLAAAFRSRTNDRTLSKGEQSLSSVHPLAMKRTLSQM